VESPSPPIASSKRRSRTSLKHTVSAHTAVVVRWNDSALDLEIVDDRPARDAVPRADRGRGLVGMRERAEMYGGKLEAGPRPEGGYAIRGRIPLELIAR
jgi:signal transduction histidine kinase